MQRGAGWGAASSGGAGRAAVPSWCSQSAVGKTFPGRLESLRLLTTEMGSLKSLPNIHF